MKNKANILSYGYKGKILTVDLTNKNFKQSSLDAELINRVFGGRGLGIALLIQHFVSKEKEGKYQNAFKEIDPFSEDNALIFSTTPMTGTGMPASGRIHVNFKSPLTDGIGSSNSGGFWAVAFKRTGNDVLIIQGKSVKPVYLKISEDGVMFLDATELLNLNVEKITDRLLKENGKGSRCMAIGEAGRKLSKIAAIMNDRGRAMGRGGGGAVMGSKNLFAILACPGKSRTVQVSSPQSLRLSMEESAGFKTMRKLDVGKMTRGEKNLGIFPTMGTLGLLGMVDAFDELVHNNFQDTKHEAAHIAGISGEALRKHSRAAPPGDYRIDVKKGACYNCPIACTRLTTIKDNRNRIIDQGEGPEFETVALMGANLSIYDLVVITEANYWANRYGLDTISLGGTIAAFFDLYRTIKTKAGTKTPEEKRFMGDVQEFAAEFGEPLFGRKEILLPLVHAIGKAEGIGKAMAEGSFRFCRRYGHPELSMSIKKLEIPAYDPRAAFLQSLAYEMCNRGACHLQNGYSAIRAYCAGYAEWPAHRIEGSAVVAKNAALNSTVMDVIGACSFAATSVGLDEFAELINAVTGQSLNAGLLQCIAWRTLTLEKIFNSLAGFTDKDDWLPDRFYYEAIEVEGHAVSCNRRAFEKMHREYYESMGWTKEGIPKKTTLIELDIACLLQNRFNGLD